MSREIFSRTDDAAPDFRVKRLVIGARDLMMLTMPKDEFDCIALHDLDLPEGCRIVAAQVLTCPAGVELFVEHPSFDPVAPGEIPPTVACSTRIVRLRRVANENGLDVYEAEARS
jgi:hypothetical protein